MAREVVFILDFCHASEHLQELAKVFMTEEVQRCDQVEIWCHHPKQHGGELAVNELESLDLTQCSAADQDNYSQLMNYLRSSLHRMDYPVCILD